MQKTITVIGHYGMSLLMDVQRFASVGETAEGIGLETEPGGKGYNQAIAASRLGADVNFITAVGGDTFGKGCDLDLQKEGVSGRFIIPFPQEKTACAFVINTADAKSEVYVYPGAIRSVTAANIAQYQEVIASSALLLVQNEVSEEALCEAISIAGKQGIEIIYNPAPARPMPEKIFQYITVLTPNETEAAILTGQDPEKPLDVDVALARLHGLGVKSVIITMGEHGSIVSTPDGRWQVEALRGKVVSTTGAGDCYNAALAVHYVQTHEILESAEYASVASGLQVQRPGVIANLPYQEEMDVVFPKYCSKLLHRQ